MKTVPTCCTFWYPIIASAIPIGAVHAVSHTHSKFPFFMEACAISAIHVVAISCILCICILPQMRHGKVCEIKMKEACSKHSSKQ